MIGSKFVRMVVLGTCALAIAAPARAQPDRAAELAKKLANPVASLVTVPVQYDSDSHGGANDGASVDRLVLLPTASKDALGTDKWGVGPTGVMLRQPGPWTVGLLAGHVWSVAGNDGRADVSSTTLQPFFSYTTATHTTIGAYTESVYAWKSKQWQVPPIFPAGRLLKLEPQIVQLAVAAKYRADSPEDGPEGWGLRLQRTFLFPK